MSVPAGNTRSESYAPGTTVAREANEVGLVLQIPLGLWVRSEEGLWSSGDIRDSPLVYHYLISILMVKRILLLALRSSRTAVILFARCLCLWSSVSLGFDRVRSVSPGSRVDR